MAYGSSTPARTAKPAAASIRGRAAIYIAGLAALALASVALMLAGRNGSNAINIPSADGAEKVSANELELNLNDLSLALLNTEKSECVKSVYTIYMTLKGDLDTEMQTFATDKSLDFGAGGGFDRFAQAFEAAADGNSMDDPDYLKVAKAKATLDQVAKYIINKHKTDTCAGQTEANKDSNLLYVIPEAQCEKVTDALVTFETNPEGKRMLDGTSGCELHEGTITGTTTPISTTTTLAPSSSTTTTPAPMPTFTVTSGPCTLAEGGRCVGRWPGGYLPNEHCDILVGGGGGGGAAGGVLGPCPIFDISTNTYNGYDALALPGGAEYQRCPAGVALATGDALSWTSSGSYQGSGGGNGLPFSSSGAGGGWQICFA
jgi:hypothetical protein